MEIRLCKKCGFILGTRPGLQERNGVCLACINSENKKNIDFQKRQNWLTDYIQQNLSPESDYDCVVAVSGGKDSHMILDRLISNHGLKRILLVSVEDGFTKTQAGCHNIENIATHFKSDMLRFRHHDFKKHTRYDFINSLHPLKWLENKIYYTPIMIAKKFGIKLVFFGENSSFEYGNSEELNIFHPASNDDVKVIYLGAIYPYSIYDSLLIAQQNGFRDLDFYHEWPRQGSIENYTQIDSYGYLIQIWTKFVKFGFQRVSDIACRFVREGLINREQALLYIKERDYLCDPIAKHDFCQAIDITEKEFDETVDRFANRELCVKDINGTWRRKDLI